MVSSPWAHAHTISLATQQFNQNDTQPLPLSHRRNQFYSRGMETFGRSLTLFKEHGELPTGPCYAVMLYHKTRHFVKRLCYATIIGCQTSEPMSMCSVKSLEVWRPPDESNMFLRSMESSTRAHATLPDQSVELMLTPIQSDTRQSELLYSCSSKVWRPLDQTKVCLRRKVSSTWALATTDICQPVTPE